MDGARLKERFDSFFDVAAFFLPSFPGCGVLRQTKANISSKIFIKAGFVYWSLAAIS